jgi:hypothetical protein
LEDVMAHEMVHAYDVLRFKTQLAADEDLRKVACSEVSKSIRVYCQVQALMLKCRYGQAISAASADGRTNSSGIR